MPVSLAPLFPGMLFDAAARFAQDNADAPQAGDPVRDMGWACTLVPEARGGVGGTLEDLAPVVEGLALHGMQLPVIEMCAVAPLLLQAAPAGTADWLQAVCEGSATVAPLIPLAAPLDELPLRARLVEGGWALKGEALGVASAPLATHWVAPARTDTDGAVALFMISREQMPSPTMHYRSMESRQAADFRLDLTLPATARIAHGEAAQRALDKAGQAAIVLTAVDTVAALAALIGQTVQHLNERHQFGVALSSFQALRHRLADMYVAFGYVAAYGKFSVADNIDMPALLAGLSRSEAHRRRTALLNAQIAEANRATLEGPPTRLAPLDVEKIVERWRAARSRGA